MLLGDVGGNVWRAQPRMPSKYLGARVRGHNVRGYNVDGGRHARCLLPALHGACHFRVKEQAHTSTHAHALLALHGACHLLHKAVVGGRRVLLRGGLAFTLCKGGAKQLEHLSGAADAPVDASLRVFLSFYNSEG